MKYSTQQAIADFDAMARQVTPTAVQKPNYAAVKNDWPAYLDFLEPIVSGRHLFGNEAVDWFQPRLVRDLTSIDDEQASERALYFGVMAMSLLEISACRNEYPAIDIDELGQLWLKQAVYPIKSLETYSFFDKVSMKGLGLMLQGFLELHVKPLVRNPQKMQDALDHFETQFSSGILLGQIVQYLTLRARYGTRNS